MWLAPGKKATNGNVMANVAGIGVGNDTEMPSGGPWETNVNDIARANVAAIGVVDDTEMRLNDPREKQLVMTLFGQTLLDSASAMIPKCV